MRVIENVLGKTPKFPTQQSFFAKLAMGNDNKNYGKGANRPGTDVYILYMPLPQPRTSLAAVSPARSLGAPLISLLVRSLEYHDPMPPTDLVHGAGIVGSIPASNSITRR